jgi:hypothetical protein
MFKNSDRRPKSSEVDYDVVEVAAPTHPKCGLMLDYWSQRRDAEGVVHRRDINPIDFRKLLGGVFVVEPVDGGRDMIYRLVGSENEQRLGMIYTGKRFTECYGPSMAAEQIAFHNRVFADGEPAFLRGRIFGLNVEHVDFEACYLPVRTDDGGHQMLGGLFDLAERE